MIRYVALATLLLLLGCGDADEPAAKSTSPTAPAFRVHTADSAARIELPETPRLAVFAASWCAPCGRLVDTLRAAPCIDAPDIHLFQLDTAATSWSLSSTQQDAADAARSLGGVYELPTSFVLLEDGTALTRIVGVPPADSLCQLLSSRGIPLQ